MSIVQRRSYPKSSLGWQAVKAFEDGNLELFDELIPKLRSLFHLLLLAQSKGSECYLGIYDRLIYVADTPFLRKDDDLRIYQDAVLEEIPPNIPREVARHILGFLPLGRISS